MLHGSKNHLSKLFLDKAHSSYESMALFANLDVLGFYFILVFWRPWQLMDYLLLLPSSNSVVLAAIAVLYGLY
jgi:hypothetical protein